MTPDPPGAWQSGEGGCARRPKLKPAPRLESLFPLQDRVSSFQILPHDANAAIFPLSYFSFFSFTKINYNSKHKHDARLNTKINKFHINK